MSNFCKFNSRDDFLSFVESVRNSFDCAEEWESFFGFSLPTDEEGNELQSLKEYAEYYDIGNEPWSYEYPVIAYCNFANNHDRFGNLRVRVFDVIPLYDIVGVDSLDKLLSD